MINLHYATMIILFGAALFCFSFAIHVLWWRISMPVRTTGALLKIFFASLAIALTIYALTADTISMPEIMQFSLLYGSSALVYIILYSAIEQESPTLAIVSYISQQGAERQSEQSLNQIFNGSHEIRQRLMLMQQTGWLNFDGRNWSLTEKGRRIARLFEYGAVMFGLNKGG